jgi:UDP-glucose 4-epimerase
MGLGANLRILLTGGFGFLGGRLAQMLTDSRQHEVTLGTRRQIDAPPWAPGAKVVTIDWADDRHLSRACRGMDAVVHLAAMNAQACARDPVAALECNGVCTVRLLRAAVEQRATRVVYLSTAHVYGAALVGTVDENTCPQPRHPYATSHRAGEDAVFTARATGTIEGVVVRLSNSFGAPAGPVDESASLLTSDLCRQAMDTRRMVLKTAGFQRRDFIPASEACRAILHLTTVPASRLGDGLFNVGSGWAPTICEMATSIAFRIEALLGFRPEIHTGIASDPMGAEGLDFQIRRLLGTGFEPRREAIVEELDRLIAGCQRQQPIKQ